MYATENHRAYHFFSLVFIHAEAKAMEIKALEHCMLLKMSKSQEKIMFTLYKFMAGLSETKTMLTNLCNSNRKFVQTAHVDTKILPMETTRLDTYAISGISFLLEIIEIELANEYLSQHFVSVS